MASISPLLFTAAALLPATSAAHYSYDLLIASQRNNLILRPSAAPQKQQLGAFQNVGCSSSTQQRLRTSFFQPNRQNSFLRNSTGGDNQIDTNKSPFLSTKKASVSFNKSNKNNNSPANISSIDSLLLNLTSDRTSLLLGVVGIFMLLLNRIISFPEEAAYEASRSRIDLLGVFAAGSVLLNGITKLDVESAVAEQVVLDGINEGGVVWNNNYDDDFEYDGNKEFVEWALKSFLICSPARTAVLLGKDDQGGQRWKPLAMTGILPLDPKLRMSIRADSTPILDRMLRDDGSIKGGTVGGTGSSENMNGPKESYLPTLQALPGKIEFSYLPSNAQEVLLLPVPMKDGGGRRYAVVLGGDTAKSFAPRDISWCREIASWLLK